MPANRHRNDPADRPSAQDGLVREALATLRDAFRDLELEGDESAIDARRSRGQTSLAPGGLILVTEDDCGVARAVAADLRALGYAVTRVRHGVGREGVEGVNLTSSAAVAALIERMRGREHLAAIVHLAPIGRVDVALAGPSSWGSPDDARALALLAQASADDLMRSATRGGSCLVVARRPDDPDRGGDRLDRWVEISARSLTGVRVRSVAWPLDADAEVFAAEVVRAVLGTDDRGSRQNTRAESRTTARASVATEAVLIGATDRASWIQIAASLADWLDESGDVRLIDVAWTLHLGQPEFPFRVGVVARSTTDLAGRLRGVISRLSDPCCRAILDPLGVYWVELPSAGTRKPKDHHPLGGRLGRFGAMWQNSPSTRDLEDMPTYPEWSGREWRNHLVASRFAKGERIRTDRLLHGRSPRTLDFASPSPSRDSTESRVDEPDFCWTESAMDVLDEILDLQRRTIMTFLSETVAR